MKLKKLTNGVIQLTEDGGDVVNQLLPCASMRVRGNPDGVMLQDETAEKMYVSVANLTSWQVEPASEISFNGTVQDLAVLLSAFFLLGRSCQTASVSAIFAYWDITGDGTEELNPIAVYLADASGTHTADQLYFQADGVTPLVIPYTATMDVLGVNGGITALGQFSAANGGLFTAGANWTGTFAASLAANFGAGENVLHTNAINFAKLVFAQANGFINSDAITMLFVLSVDKTGVGTSTNGGNILILGINCSQERFNNPRDLVTFTVGGFDNFYVANSANEAVGNNPRVGLLAECWTNNNFVDDVTSRGQFWCDVDANDSNSATGVTLYNSGAFSATDTRKIFYAQVTGVDAYGMPNFGSAVDLGVFVSTPSNTSAFALSRDIRINGTPPILVRSVQAKSNAGTYVAPDYLTDTLDLNAEFPGLLLAVTTDIDADAASNWFLANAAPQVVLYEYSGAATSAAFATGANWAATVISTTTTGAQGIAADLANMVNSFPTLYVASTTLHIIYRITKNAGAGWTTVTIAGTSGVPGNADGIGLAATFTAPYGLHISPVDGFLYITQRTSSNIRTMNTTTLQTAQFRGEFAGTGSTNAIQF